MKITAVVFTAVIAVVVTAIVAYRLGKSRRETFDASRVRDPKVREEMEYLKKMYFS